LAWAGKANPASMAATSDRPVDLKNNVHAISPSRFLKQGRDCRPVEGNASCHRISTKIPREFWKKPPAALPLAAGPKPLRQSPTAPAGDEGREKK